MTSDEVSRRLGEPIPVQCRISLPRLPHVSLTLRLCILMLIAIFPAILIQGYNEYELRKARERAAGQREGVREGALTWRSGRVPPRWTGPRASTP